MGIANFPFPSFTLLLTSDRVVIPGPSYVIRLAPSDNNMNEEYYPLANLDFEDDSITDVALGHCDSKELGDDVTETVSMSTGPVQRTIAGNRQAEAEVGVEIKFRFPFLKPRPTARFHLKNIFKRLSQFKLNQN